MSGKEAIGNLLGWQIDTRFLEGKSDLTRKAYIKYIRDFFRAEDLKDVPLDHIYSVSILDAQLYHKDLMRQGFQPGSINQQMIALSHFYDFLIDNKVINVNPFCKLNRAEFKKKSRNDSLDSLLKKQISEWPDNAVKEVLKLKELIAEHQDMKIGFWKLLTYLPKWKVQSKANIIRFLDIIEDFDIGMEPDLRFTGMAPKMNSDVLMFSLAKYKNKTQLSPAFAFAILNIKIGVLVSKIDGKVVEDEIALLRNKIDVWPGLNNLQKKRCTLFLDWLLSEPIEKKGMGNVVRNLSFQQKDLVGEWLLKVSEADGIIRPEEADLMRKLYVLMNLNTEELDRKMESSKAISKITKINKSPRTDTPTATELLNYLLDYIG